MTGDVAGDVAVIHGDCLDVLPTLEAGSVDAIVTDPPYGLNFQGENWDAFIPKWLAEARRVAPIVAFATGPLTLWDYPRPDWVCCWHRPGSTSRSKLKGGFNHWSPVLVYGAVKFPIDTIDLPAIANVYPRDFGHPSPKPTRLMKWIVENVCPRGGLVLDPFAGSGTTGVACMKTGRRCILIEKDERYIPLIHKRLKGAETPLFQGLSM